MQDNQAKPITGRGRGSNKAFHLSQQPQAFCLNLFSPAKNQSLPVKMPLPASNKQVDNYSSNKILKFYSQKVAKRSKGIQERCSKALSEWYVLNWSKDLRKLYFLYCLITEGGRRGILCTTAFYSHIVTSEFTTFLWWK